MKKQPPPKPTSLWDDLVSESEGFVYVGRKRATHWRYARLFIDPSMGQYTFYVGPQGGYPCGFIRLPALDTQEDVNSMGNNLLMLFNMSLGPSDE